MPFYLCHDHKCPSHYQTDEVAVVEPCHETGLVTAPQGTVQHPKQTLLAQSPQADQAHTQSQRVACRVAHEKQSGICGAP